MPRAGANYQPIEIVQSPQRSGTVVHITVDRDGTTTVSADDPKEDQE